MENDLLDIIITVNSPGELYSLTRPIVKTINKHIPFSRIFIVITPCQYASGKEIEVARTFSEVFDVILPQEYSNWIFRNKPPKGIIFSKKGIVIYLGGDLVNGVLLSKKLNYPAVAYSMNKISWINDYKLFFVPDRRVIENTSKNIPREKIKIVGELMVDAAFCKEIAEEPKNKFDVVFMPGSRSAHIKFLAPFFIRVADTLSNKNNELKFAMALSPYTSSSQLEDFIIENNLDKTEKKYGNSGRIINDEDKKIIISDKKTKILMIEKNQYLAMNSAKLLITIPGTNTAEAAAMGIPMLVIIPTHKPEAFIFDGIVGLIGNLPIFGQMIKKIAISILSKKEKYISLPNRKANEMIVPELIGKIEAEQIAQKAFEMLSNEKELEKISFQLKKIMGPKGASEKIVEEIISLL